MHTLSTSFILGYHGCDRTVAERVLAGEPFVPSTNDYDWLGHGIYFWEANPRRGLDFAQELAGRPRGSSKVRDPAVVGAVIELRACLDLTTASGLAQVKFAYDTLLEATVRSSRPQLPKNRPDGLRRHLDCAVINALHDINAERGLPVADTVKGAFIEGPPIYPDGGFHEKTHIQIRVRNQACIKGVFRVRPDALT